MVNVKPGAHPRPGTPPGQPVSAHKFKPPFSLIVTVSPAAQTLKRNVIAARSMMFAVARERAASRLASAVSDPWLR